MRAFLKKSRMIFIYIFKLLRFFQFHIAPYFFTIYTRIYLWLNGVEFYSLKSNGIPFVNLAITGEIIIGKNFKINNNIISCQSGYNGKCRIEVHKNAKLLIGDNVGISATTITCFSNIIIENNVNLGVGVHIYDTDFHSINPEQRLNSQSDKMFKKNSPIVIEENVFVGAHSIILKGVRIGQNAVIGAGSVVTKNVPQNEIWAGNPARFIKSVNRNAEQ